PGRRGPAHPPVTSPAAVAAGATAVDGGKLNFGMAVTFFKPLPCTAGYGATRYRNGLDLGTTPALNTGAACTSSAADGYNVRGAANAPRGGPVPEPARPGSLPSGGGGARTGGPAALPGALALPGQTGEAPGDMTDLLAPGVRSAR
ncbi:ABC transporter substrate-binding protein, partial [Streptomyces pilosus]